MIKFGKKNISHVVIKLRDDLCLRSNIAVHTPEHTGLQAPPADPAAVLTSEFEDYFIANRVEEDELGGYLQDNFTKAD